MEPNNRNRNPKAEANTKAEEGKPVTKTDASKAELDKWKKDNFSPRWGLLQHPGADYSVHRTFQMYLDSMDYSPEKLWDMDDHGSSIIKQIRKQHKALSTALKTDRKSEEVEKYLSEEMWKEYEYSQMSPEEREIAEALAKAETAAIITVIKRRNTLDNCRVNVTALEHLCNYLQGESISVMTKKLEIFSFVRDEIDTCKPWDLLEITREEWLETYLQLAGILPKTTKASGTTKAKEEEEEEDYNIPF
jgi:hypothetical protein